MIIALITNKKKPKENIVKGIEKKTSAGLIKLLSSDNTKAIINALIYCGSPI
jgi:hypothetical protein